MLRKTLLAFSWLLLLIIVVLVLLIVLPAPVYTLWLAAVAATEWSFWLLPIGLLGAMGIVCAQSPRRNLRQVFLQQLLLPGLIIIVCTMIPVVSAYTTAIREGVSLSPIRYLFGKSPAIPAGEEHNIPFATTGGQTLLLDVYRTKSPQAQGLPAILVIHGGAWSRGEKSDFAEYNRWLSHHGYVVFDIQYRLARQDMRFPAQIIDVQNALTWVRNNAASYHVDPERIALLGRSAGGQLALLAGYAEESFGSDVVEGVHKMPVRALISLYAPIDLVWGYQHPGCPDIINTTGTLENYLGGPPLAVPQAYSRASPGTHITASAPPTLFIHGGRDQLVSKKHVYFTMPKLQAAGVPCEFLYLPWANHGFDFNFNGWGSQIAQAKILAFLKKYL